MFYYVIQCLQGMKQTSLMNIVKLGLTWKNNLTLPDIIYPICNRIGNLPRW